MKQRQWNTCCIQIKVLFEKSPFDAPLALAIYCMSKIRKVLRLASVVPRKWKVRTTGLRLYSGEGTNKQGSEACGLVPSTPPCLFNCQESERETLFNIQLWTRGVPLSLPIRLLIMCWELGRKRKWGGRTPTRKSATSQTSISICKIFNGVCAIRHTSSYREGEKCERLSNRFLPGLQIYSVKSTYYVEMGMRKWECESWNMWKWNLECHRSSYFYGKTIV